MRADAGQKARPRGVRSILLGIFILLQLGFLLTANLLPILEKLGIRSVIGDHVKAFAQSWSTCTGQAEGWSLYAPHVPKQAPFVATELVWDSHSRWSTPAQSFGDSDAYGGAFTPWKVHDDAAPHRSHEIRATTEPLNPTAYFRPFGTSRLAAFEAHLSLIYWGWNAEAVENPEPWRLAIAEFVARNEAAIQAYLRWQSTRFHDSHAESSQPSAAILRVRVVPMPGFDTGQRACGTPIDLPVARLQLATNAALEVYNPARQRFNGLDARE